MISYYNSVQGLFISPHKLVYFSPAVLVIALSSSNGASGKTHCAAVSSFAVSGLIKALFFIGVIWFFS
jgi:hypothetical protein